MFRKLKITLQRGFTLIEILIALFVFSIIALILSGALHNVIGIQGRTEESADRLRRLQFALLLVSRDLQQAVNRPILNPSGRLEAAFIGKTRSVTFTHAGIVSSSNNLHRSNMQREQYTYEQNALWRDTWDVLDQPPDAKPHKRILLRDVTDLHFEYIDGKNKVHPEWPLQGQSSASPLPKAVRMFITISNWGSMSQLYVIPIQQTKQVSRRPR